MQITNCKLSKRVQNKLLEFFVLQVTVRSATDILDIQPNSAIQSYRKIRIGLELVVAVDGEKAVRSSLCLPRCVRFLPLSCLSRFRAARWLKVKRRRDWRQTLPKRRTRKP